MLRPEIRDELIAAFVDEEDDSVQNAVMRTLDEHCEGDPVVLEHLLAVAGGTIRTEESTREIALGVIFKQITDDAVQRTMVELLSDRDPSICARVAHEIVRASERDIGWASDFLVSDHGLDDASVLDPFNARTKKLLSQGAGGDQTARFLEQFHSSSGSDRARAADLLGSAGRAREEAGRAPEAGGNPLVAVAIASIRALGEVIDDLLATDDVTELERGFLTDLQLHLATLEDLVEHGRFDSVFAAEASRLERLGNAIGVVATRPETLGIAAKLLSSAKDVKDLVQT